MKNLFVLLVFIMIGYSSIQAQALVPRFYWLDFLDTMGADDITMPELRQAIDSIDFTTVSEEDKQYLAEKISAFDKKYKEKYGKKPFDRLPASTIHISGLKLTGCTNMIEKLKSFAVSVEGVESADVIMEEDNLLFFYHPEYQLEIVDKVVTKLREKLEGCGFKVYNIADTHLIEVQQEFADDAQFFKDSKGKGFDCNP